MAIDYARTDDGEMISALQPVRIFPLFLAMVSTALVAVAMAVALTEPLPILSRIILLVTAAVAGLIAKEAVDATGGVTLTMTTDGLQIDRLLGRRVIAWEDIEEVSIEPANGRFSDPRRGDPEDLAVGLYLTGLNRSGMADVITLTVGAADIDDAAQISARLRSFKRRVESGVLRLERVTA